MQPHGRLPHSTLPAACPVPRNSRTGPHIRVDGTHEAGRVSWRRACGAARTRLLKVARLGDWSREPGLSVSFGRPFQVSRWRYHRNAVKGGRRRHAVVVGHDAVELVAELQRGGEVESVQAPQLPGVTVAARSYVAQVRLNKLSASSTDRARCIPSGAAHRVARRSSVRSKSLASTRVSWVASQVAMACEAGWAVTSLADADVSMEGHQ